MSKRTKAEIEAENAVLQSENENLRELLRDSHDLLDDYLFELKTIENAGQGTLEKLISEYKKRFEMQKKRSVAGAKRRVYQPEDIARQMDERREKYGEGFSAASEQVAGMLDADPTTMRRNYHTHYKNNPPRPNWSK